MQYTCIITYTFLCSCGHRLQKLQNISPPPVEGVMLFTKLAKRFAENLFAGPSFFEHCSYKQHVHVTMQYRNLCCPLGTIYPGSVLIYHSEAQKQKNIFLCHHLKIRKLI